MANSHDISCGTNNLKTRKFNGNSGLSTDLFISTLAFNDNLKVYSNELSLFQLTNDLCRSFTKIVIILFLSKAVFIKRTLLFQYFVLKIEPP